MKSLLVIKDLPLDDTAEGQGITLSSTKMRGIVGRRSVLTQVDRNGLSTFDDFPDAHRHLERPRQRPDDRLIAHANGEAP